MDSKTTVCGKGIHFLSGGSGYRAQDVALWAPELSAMGMRWVVVDSPASRAIPEDFLAGFSTAGIEPIALLDGEAISDPGDAQRSIYRLYRRNGVRFVVPTAPPNLRSSWKEGAWSVYSPVDRYVSVFAAHASALAEEGLFPVFPALAPGGDYWDLAFFEAFLIEAMRLGHELLLRRTVFGVEGNARNRPLDWGAGGASRWPDVRPYVTPPGSQDHFGFRRFDWIEEIARRVLGDSVPLIGFHAGAPLGDSSDPQYPVVDPIRHADANAQTALLAETGALDAPLVCQCFWHLFVAESYPASGQAWFRNDGTALPVVEAFKRRHASVSPKSAPPSEKTLRHYLLLPESPMAVDAAGWERIRGFLQAFRPSCGFSVDEAALAEKVTIFGDSNSSTSSLQLRECGCVVDYLAPEPH